MKRRDFMIGAAALPLTAALPKLAFAQNNRDGKTAWVGTPWDAERNAMVIDASHR